MIGSRIPNAKRLINSVAPLDPTDLSEANALNIMYLLDLLSDGEYVQDMAILQRHLSQLNAHEQNSPNLTVRVEPGTAWFGQNSYVTFAGGNSPTIAAPASNPRRDIVTIRNDGNLYVLPGAEAGSPVAPTIPSTDVAICQVYCVVGMTAINDNDTQVGGQGYIEYDLRPLFQRPLGSDAMPKIGIVEKVRASSATPGYHTLIDYTGSGRLKGINFYGSPGPSGRIRLTIDGTAWVLNAVISSDQALIFESAYGAVGTAFAFTAGAATFTELGGGVFFKSGLKIEYDPVANSTSTIAAIYEHE